MNFSRNLRQVHFIYVVLFPLLICFSLYASDSIPVYLQDRNGGIATSMFGTYVEKGHFLVYPFYEFYYDHNTEYSPGEFGYSDQKDYEGKSIAHEGLIYAAYGITDWLMFEFEIAGITETLWKADKDTSGMPDSIHEDGLGDVEGQFRWRYFRETEKRPELFNYFEVVLPLQKERQLIGTQAWEFKLGIGILKGFKWGTITGRLGVEYDTGEEEFELGEYAVEYLRRVSDRVRLFAMIEGSMDEVELIAECHVIINKHLYLKIGSGFGITPNATDIAPEAGPMFVF